MRLQALGAKNVQITGNIKFDIAPDPALVDRGLAWRQAYGESRPVVLAASTRDGEEALLIQALRAADIPDLLLVIVPRHPQRFDSVAALLEREAVAYQRRSSEQPIAASTRVLLGDSMGEMPAYYAACDLAIIGGSLLPYGAQNLIEACAVGKPVIIGTHIYNFAEVTRLALVAGAALQVQDARGALAAARELLRDAGRIQRMAESARQFANEHQGATARLIDLIKVAGSAAAKRNR